jgi:hypothetical protein
MFTTGRAYPGLGRKNPLQGGHCVAVKDTPHRTVEEARAYVQGLAA